MKPSPSFWLIVAALTILTVAPKSLPPSPWNALTVQAGATEDLRRFLASRSDAPPVRVLQKPPVELWAGWRFSAGGCPSIAFPSGVGNELNNAARLYATPADRVEFIYRGEVTDTAPTARLAFDYLVARFFRRPWPYSVVLIRPSACAAPRQLAWAKLR